MEYVDIFYGKYLSDEKKITVGGIQTYITDLCKVISELGIKTRIFQFANEDFVHALSEDVCVFGFRIEDKRYAHRCQKLYDEALRSRKTAKILSIFATDSVVPPIVTEPCIAIQHGISWDVPIPVHRTLIRQLISRGLFAYPVLKRLNRINSVICVDYNFLSWYRTQVDRIPGYAEVIPNYAVVAPEYNKPSGTVKIIFARRLFTYRGTRVFTEAVCKLLEEGTNIEVTVAGTGEDAQWMHEHLDKYQNVRFITYESHESLEIHKDQHIAVVPTVGSEGTSLSLLEAMSAQCAVICTNVGGMTNIVIDGFNGLMVDAGNAEQLYRAMRTLVDDAQMRQRLAKNGYETVKQGFSYEKWRTSWKKVLEEYL